MPAPEMLGMEWNRTRGWGLFNIVWGLAVLLSVPSAGSSVLMALLATLGFGLLYYGISMVRSGKY